MNSDNKDKKAFAALADRLMDRYNRIVAHWTSVWNYCAYGVWSDHRNTLKVNIVKTVNLTVKTFMSTDLQSKACAMTYRTLLAIVPLLALAFAICRGFGFQGALQEQLFQLFPSQHKALDMALKFVDSCLAQASEGIFVGVGIVFLLWTVISLLDSVEETFNQIWNVTVGRSLFRKVTDYMAICIILPILMICSSGLQILMSNAIQRFLHFEILTPVIEIGLDCMSFVFAWLFFAGAYMLIPNAKVKFKNAFVAGALAGTSFQVLQWLFLTGQLYVSKYNAIYGSFSFLPLMLIWMQLSWLITLAGALVCCSAQNISMFAYGSEIEGISDEYKNRVCVALLSVAVKRFVAGEKPLTPVEMSVDYDVPSRLVSIVTDKLLKCGLLVRVLPEGESEIVDNLPVQPALPVDFYTIGNVLSSLGRYGYSGFIAGFDALFPKIDDVFHKIENEKCGDEGEVHLTDL